MTRFLFNGPDGAPWVGKTLRMIDPRHARNRDLWEMQRQSGLSMPEINEVFGKTKDDGMVGAANAIVEFLTLRNAGFAVTWDQALDLTSDDIDEISEPELDQAAADPTTPAESTAPAGEPNAAARKPATSPRSSKSRGSKRRSTAAS